MRSEVKAFPFKDKSRQQRKISFHMLWVLCDLSSRTNNLLFESPGSSLCSEYLRKGRRSFWDVQYTGFQEEVQADPPRNFMLSWDPTIESNSQNLQGLMQLSVNVSGLPHAVKNLQPICYKGSWETERLSNRHSNWRRESYSISEASVRWRFKLCLRPRLMALQ